MAELESALLFCPPGPPLTLEAGGRVTIGRAADCGLRLPSGDASRQHAEIVGGEAGYTIRDLGSTNGTFVNGKRVGEHRLEPGDRIQIGSSTITFCQLGRDTFDPCDAGGDANDRTIIAERPVSNEVLRGDLAEIPPYAILQMLEMGRKSGELRIDADDEAGRIWFVDGRPIHAETKQLRGFDAGVAIAGWTDGRFRLAPLQNPPQATIDAGVTEILLEASRLLDETSD
jgi:hypothetical protein